MEKIIKFLEEKFVPVAGRIGSQRHLVAVRDGFVTIMPLIIAGSLAVLVNNFPNEAYQNFMQKIFTDKWTSFGGNIWNGTFAVTSLLIIFTIAYSLAKSYDSDPLAAGIVSFASLMTITAGAEGAWAIPYAWTGAQGLFVSIIVAIISTEIFTRLLGNKKLNIKMPSGVPPAVAKSFAALLPGMITIAVFSFIRIGTVAAGIANIHQAIFEAIQGPLSNLGQSIWSAITIAFSNHLLWFFGLHGSNILEPIMQSVYLPALEANMAALQSGIDIPNIVTKPFFDVFVYMGGSGTTISLLIAIYIASLRKKYRSKRLLSTANLGFAPGIFNINEPVMFGLPIVLNPMFIIPFIFIPVVLTIISYGAIASGLVPRTIAMVPWTTPPILGGYLAVASWRGIVLQLFNLGIAVLCYFPFIVLSERSERKKAKEEA
ncbi:PTS sugar transporter subunit IIC [Dethiothermospora halolimnae]|uniref:PTS sugar transporter subunit IIC n=1 Tax=Dethiothermospora halolimnae TaxID=3114390 RepID=UPI003CCBD7C0